MNDAWSRLFPEDEANPLDGLAPEARVLAGRAAYLILAAHRGYLSEFNRITVRAKDVFERRAWREGVANAEARVQLYRDAIDRAWTDLRDILTPTLAVDRGFWMAARRLLLERVIPDYDADLAMAFFYSMMRLAFDGANGSVEYADDGLSVRNEEWDLHPEWRVYPAGELLGWSIRQALESCGFRAEFEDVERDAGLVAKRLAAEWAAQTGQPAPRDLQMLTPVFYRDQEAYLVGKLRGSRQELPVVLALRHGAPGIAVDAVLAGREDMRNILFISTRSTFHVRTDAYREAIGFLDALAPERGHPAMCAVIGFTHPARVALNQKLRSHLRETGERFSPVPGRKGMAMIVFAPPGFPYVFKVIRDASQKAGWAGRGRIMELYRWVHEMNRGRLMLDAWMYRNLHFSPDAFDPRTLNELVQHAPNSVRIEDGTVVLKDVYAQRRVRPMNTFFDETRDAALRERAIDAMGVFIKDLAAMGFFFGDCYGLPFNIGLTHGFNVALFDFDDLGPLVRYNFRRSPEPAGDDDDPLWNSETDGAWAPVGENDVLVDEWERYLGVPQDLAGCFRRRHGDLFTPEFWARMQERIRAGELHYVRPYPADRKLPASRSSCSA